MLTYFHATIETRLATSEIAARIRSRTFEADPNKWWWRHNVGDSRWVGFIAQNEFMLRRPFMTEGFMHPRLGYFYRQVGLNGVVTDTGAKRVIAFSAGLRPPAIIGYTIMFIIIAAICLASVILGDMRGKVSAMLFLGFIAFGVRYMWWGFKACAQVELRFLEQILDAAIEEPSSSAY